MSGPAALARGAQATMSATVRPRLDDGQLGRSSHTLSGRNGSATSMPAGPRTGPPKGGVYRVPFDGFGPASLRTRVSYALLTSALTAWGLAEGSATLRPTTLPPHSSFSVNSG